MRLAAHSVPLDGQNLNARSLLAYVQGALFTTRPLPGFERFPGYVEVERFLQRVWTTAQGRSGADARPPASAPATPATASTYTTSLGRQAAVICGESPNPATPPGYVNAARASYRRAGPNIWPFAAMCRGWSVKSANRYLGPWTTAALPVLVIGNTFDPATPYSSSERMAAELANGHLLSVDGFGHTVLLNPNRCAQDHVASYLIDGAAACRRPVCGGCFTVRAVAANWRGFEAGSRDAALVKALVGGAKGPHSGPYGMTPRP